MTAKAKYKSLFYSVQKLINNFDPFGLSIAPIDEYDDLSRNVLSILLNTDDYTKKYNDIVKVITDYSFMDIKSVKDINELARKLIEIDVNYLGA